MAHSLNCGLEEGVPVWLLCCGMKVSSAVWRKWNGALREGLFEGLDDVGELLEAIGVGVDSSDLGCDRRNGKESRALK